MPQPVIIGTNESGWDLLQCRAVDFQKAEFRVVFSLGTCAKQGAPEDEPVDTGDAKIAVIGMGQLGTGVYDQLAPDYGDVLIGIDGDADIIATHEAAGRNVVHVDVTDDEAWETTIVTPLEVGILALRHHQENLGFVKRVREHTGDVKLFSVASHADEVAELIDAGAEAAWNMYSEAGIGLASEVISYYKNEETDNSE